MDEYGGSWSEAKLACVQEYAAAYLKVMQNQSWATLHYVDAFAGSGMQKLKRSAHGDETFASLFGDKDDQLAAQRFIEGSPLRVLRASIEATRGFNECRFVELSQKSCSLLEEHVRYEFGDDLPATQFICSDANRFLRDYAQSYDRTRFRSLVFLDPFGCEVEWETVAALGRTQACDVWYLFPLGGAMRMMTLSGQIEPSWEANLDAIFGTGDWRSHFYETTTQETLFGDKELTTRDATTDRVVEYIVQRLGESFAGVAAPAILRNSQNSPMFALILAVANPSPPARTAALKIANHLTRKLNLQS